jgi:hypothetical protein
MRGKIVTINQLALCVISKFNNMNVTFSQLILILPSSFSLSSPDESNI